MMYHCRLRFYLTGCRREWADIIRAIPPLKGFTHEFIESGEPEAVLAAGADVILAGLGAPEAALAAMLADKREGTELILLQQDGERLPEDLLEQAADIWTAGTLRFRFQRRQKLVASPNSVCCGRSGPTRGKPASIWRPPSTAFPA